MMNCTKKTLCRLTALLVALAMFLPYFSSALMKLAAAYDEAQKSYTFDYGTDSRVIVIDAKFIEEHKGYTRFVIPDGAFSVTVSGDVEVEIIFKDVTINRADDKAGDAIQSSLYEAGMQLGWTKGTNMYYVPTCPFLITSGASVRARFDGACTFRAGTNRWYAVSSSPRILQQESGYLGGYAAIQIDGDASLTIAGAENLKCYGAYQLAGQTIGGYTYDANDPIRVNSQFFRDGRNPWARPSGVSDNGECGGGAGIGGGATYNQTTAMSSAYTAGTPGEIIIETGKIYAVGGHLAAGIGGGINSAVTTKQVVIDGGEVTAVGGRFACGIGAGDSTNGNVSESFYKEKKIVINGGTVLAYGGVSSAAIGTTDNLTIENKITIHADPVPCTIEINGGYVYAQSGEAYDNATPATAAIGAGQNSDLEDNGISISESATVVASSFSQFAVSNVGTDASLRPMLHIDPHAYMYFLRFTPSTSEREVKMHPIKRDASGNFMLVAVPTTAFASDGSLAGTYSFYAHDPEQGYYRVNEDGTPILSGGERIYVKTDLALSYYFDLNTVVGNITVPAKYSAVARTLPDPALYGGYYVLRIPVEDKEGKATFVYSIVEKNNPGVTTAAVVDGLTKFEGDTTAAAPSEYHVIIDKDGNITEESNVKVDPTASSLTHLEVTTPDGNGYIGADFSEYINGYTVYLPYGQKTFTLSSVYSVLENIGTTVSMEIQGASEFTYRTKYYDSTWGSSGWKDLSGISSRWVSGEKMSLYHDPDESEPGKELPGTLMENDITVEMGNNDSIEIWIRKTDTESGLTGTARRLNYKITVIAKPRYALVVDSLTKVYDGMPAAVNRFFMTSAGGRIVTNTAKTERDSTEYFLNPDANHKLAEGIFALSNGISYDFKVTDGNSTFASGAHKARFVVTVGQHDDIEHSASLTVTVDLSTGDVSFTGAQSGGGITLSGRDGMVLMAFTVDGKRVASPFLNFHVSGAEGGGISESLITEKEVQDKELALAAELAKKLTDETGDMPPHTSAQGTLTYPVRKTSHEVTVSFESASGGIVDGILHTHIYNAATTTECIETMRVYREPNEDIHNIMLSADRERILYTYYQDINGDGVLDEAERKTGTSTAPTAAGTYIVMMTLDTEHYEALGSTYFTIERRPVTVTGISNWLRYVYRSELADYHGEIADLGAIYLSGVVSGDHVAVTAGGSYVDFGVKGSFLDDVGFDNEKIYLTDIHFDKTTGYDDWKNYVITHDTCYVAGQIIYKTDSAIFCHIGFGIPGAKWDKFYPPSASLPLNFEMIDGVYIDPGVDYHSPSNTEHRDYVRLRTVNGMQNSARYAVDIEYGAMQFSYTKAVWDVNSYQYVDVEGESRWSGHDGVNNRIIITNYSNRAVAFTAESQIDFIYGSLGGADGEYGIRSAVSRNAGSADAQYVVSGRVHIDAATPGMSGKIGTPAQSEVYVVLTGIPQLNSKNFMTVGSVTVSLYGVEKDENEVSGK